MQKLYLADWKEDFYPQILNFTKEKTQSCAHEALLVLPTKRAKQVCFEFFQKEEPNTLLPEILSFDEFINLCKISWSEKNAREIDLMESVQFLYEIVSELAVSQGKNSEKKFFASLLSSEQNSSFFYKELESFHYFYKYGIDLHEIINECFDENIVAFSLQNTSDVIDEFSSYLLSVLKAIALKYKDKLDSHTVCTASYVKFCLAQAIGDVYRSLPYSFKNTPIIFCGLENLSKSEEVIVEYFLQIGAYYLCVSDPLLLEAGAEAHWSAEYYKNFAKKIEGVFELLPALNNKNAEEKKYFFNQAFDIHSQFQNLSIAKNTERTACILNSSDSLLPLLYTLNTDYRADELNISSGFPLRQSKIVQCIYLIEKMRNEALKIQHEHSLCYTLNTQDCLEFLSYDFFISLREEVKAIIIEQNIPNIQISSCCNDDNILKFFEKVIFSYFEVQSLTDMKMWVENFCSYIENQKHIEEDFEKLALIKLQEISRSWEGKTYENILLGTKLCISIFLDWIEKCVVPFVYNSDDALQILPLNQTTTLQFDILYVFDANDDLLPKKSKENPMLPDKFRPLLGLKTASEREKNFAHTWYRLISGARTVHLYWQESNAKGLFDSKKIRSPYVEEALWNVEQQRIRLIDSKHDSDIYKQAQCALDLSQKEHSVQCSAEIKKHINARLTKGISSSGLDTFLMCPLQFFYKYICRLQEVQVVRCEENYALLGSLVHEYLSELYIDCGEMRRDILQKKCESSFQEIDNYLKKHKLYETFPAESVLLLKKSFPFRINKYLENQPEVTHVLYVEKKLQALLKNKFQLTGIIDRIDERSDISGRKQHLIIDYKTGTLKTLPSLKFWSESIYNYQECLNNNDFSLDGDNSLSTLYKNVGSVQLPFYAVLAQNIGININNLAYIDLNDTASEKLYFPEEIAQSSVMEISSKLIEYLCNYIENINTFSRHEATNCDYCAYRRYCH